jgi:hypothetical protein
MQSVAEKERMKEEAKAIENLKKEEQRAENVIYEAKVSKKFFMLSVG